MNSRFVLMLAALLVVLCVGAYWFLSTKPPAPRLSEVSTPARVESESLSPPKPSLLSKSKPGTVVTAPAAQPRTEWQTRIDAVLRATPDDDTVTAQALIDMLPALPPEGQLKAAQHISGLLDDTNYYRILPVVKNPSMPEEVLNVLVTDLLNRDEEVRLPVLLAIAKVSNHPFHRDAADDLEGALGEDYGSDWKSWDTALKAYLKEQAEENAASQRGRPKK